MPCRHLQCLLRALLTHLKTTNKHSVNIYSESLYRLQSCAGTCILDWIKCQQQDNYRNALSDFIDLSFNWELSFTSHMLQWAQWIRFGNKTVFIIFMSMLQPSKGKKENTAIIFYGCNAPGGSFFHNPLTEVLTMHQQGTPELHLNFLPIQEHFLQCPVISFSITGFPHASFLLWLHPRFTFTDKTCKIYKNK